MDALTTLVPVFAMILLGLLCRIKGWISEEQKNGTKAVIFNILFPILIFNAIATSSMSSSTVYIVIYVTIAFFITFMIGKLLGSKIGGKYGHVSPYLLTTVEGGNVALPLYTSIVGSAYMINTVTFDMGGTIIAFILLPILLAKKEAGNLSLIDLVKKVFSSSFIIAVILGLIMNLTGLYSMIHMTAIGDIYTNTMSMLIGPITGMILFTIGYDLKIEKDAIKPLLKVMLTRVVLFLGIIAGFYLIFPTLMQQKEFMIAVWLYFLCPTGFAIPAIVSSEFKDKSDESFMSAFMSLFMIITLIVYTILVLFVA